MPQVHFLNFPDDLHDAVDTLATSLSSGIFVGRYQITRTLGVVRGLETYAAFHTQLGSQCVLQRPVAGRPDLEDVILESGRRHAALHHPNIARIQDLISDTGGRPVLVTEWLEGASLQTWLSRGRLTLAATTGIAAQLLSALSYAHCSGIPHGALDPSNIWLVQGTHGLVVKVLRFGTANLESHAPGEEYDTPHQDMCALGRVLYRALTGEAPPADDPDRIQEALHEAAPDSPQIFLQGVARAIQGSFSDSLGMLSALSGVLPEPAPLPQEGLLRPDEEPPPPPTLLTAPRQSVRTLPLLPSARFLGAGLLIGIVLAGYGFYEAMQDASSYTAGRFTSPIPPATHLQVLPLPSPTPSEAVQVVVIQEPSPDAAAPSAATEADPITAAAPAEPGSAEDVLPAAAEDDALALVLPEEGEAPAPAVEAALASEIPVGALPEAPAAVEAEPVAMVGVVASMAVPPPAAPEATATEPEAPPAPEPPARPVVPLGSWEGDLEGRPMTLSIINQEGGVYVGAVRIFAGGSWRTFPVRGRLYEDTLLLQNTEQKLRVHVTIRGGKVVAGTVALGGQRSQRWTP